MISWKGNLVPSLSTIVSLSFLNNVELSYRGTSFKDQGGSVIAAFFWAHNYVSEQFGNYVEYGTCIHTYIFMIRNIDYIMSHIKFYYMNTYIHIHTYF